MLEAQVQEQQAKILRLESMNMSLMDSSPSSMQSSSSARVTLDHLPPATSSLRPLTTAAASSGHMPAPLTAANSFDFDSARSAAAGGNATVAHGPQAVMPSPALSSTHQQLAASPATSLHASDHTSPHSAHHRPDELAGASCPLDTLPVPLVHSLLALYQKHYSSWLPLFSPHLQLQWPWPLVTYAMVSAALRLPQAVPLLSNADSMRMACRQHVVAIATESTSLETLQALTILVFETIASGADPSERPFFRFLRCSVPLVWVADDKSLAQATGAHWLCSHAL